MIDFRYHLVSLVAVFLALAIGIVLGAGPLQEDLGSALTDQVAELREERAELRSELDATRSRLDEAREDADDYAESTLPLVVDGRLSGAEVAVVVMPEGSAQLRDATLDTLEQAGGRVSSVTQLQEAWTDPGQASTRDELAAQLLRTGVTLPESLSDTPDLPAVLAAGLTGTAGPEAAATVADRLSAAGVIELQTTDPLPTATATPPDAVVLIGGGGSTVLPAPDAGAQDRLDLEVRTVAAVGATTVPTVLVGDVASAEAATGSPSDALISAVRAETEAAGAVSTVDNGAGALGQAAGVLALVLGTTGEVGAFGVADDAEAVLPDPASLPAAPWGVPDPGDDPADVPVVPELPMPEAPSSSPTTDPA